MIGPGSAAPRRAPRASAVLLPLVVGGVLVTAGCTGGDGGAGSGAAATGSTTASSTAPATGGSATPSTTAPSTPPTSGTTSPGGGTGCPPGGDPVPAGATTAASGDLDRDGAPDELWMADVDGQRLLGVRTASGAVFSTAYTSAAPERASAIGQQLGDDDLSDVVLLDAGRSVALYSVQDCALVPTTNAQGAPYTFDLGFTGYGTGVGCVDLGSGLQLVGLDVVTGDDGRSTVTRTAIELSGYGASARNGASAVVATGAGPEDPAVVSGRTVTCGDQDDPVVEPEG